MKTKIIAISILSILISSCALTGVIGSGNRETEERTVSEFNGIILETAADISLSIGDLPSITVSADDNILELISTKVKNGKLIISQSSEFQSEIGVNISIVTKSLDSIILDGAGNINATGINSENFNVELDGAGDIKASGECTNLDIDLNGAGDVKLYGLVSKSAKARLDGAGNIEVYATDTLVAKINGAGDINYKGSCSLDSSIDGVGDIRNKN